MRSTLRGLQLFDGLLGPLWKEDRPAMDSGKVQPQMTAGLDLGDKHSYLCLIDQQSGEVIEEGLLCAPPPQPSGDASPPSSLLCASP
jgi:hypothetical protein